MDKNKVLKSNISKGVIWKAISLVFVYLTVPFLLDYLGKEYYGVWITIFTLLNTAYFMDIGIALGLKNKLTSAIAEKDFFLAKTYISTAYFSISFIVVILLLIGISLVFVFDMSKILNVSISERDMKGILLISMILVFISVVLNIYKSIFKSFQESAKIELAMMLYQGLIFIQIILLPSIASQSILLVSLVYGLTNIFIAIVFTYMFYRKHMVLFPSFKFYKRNRIREILGLGLNFFIIQLALIIILSTDNLIITSLISPESTTTYSIVYKVFQPFLIISALIFSPLWTLYTDAYHNKDFNWIKNTLRRLNYLFILLVVTLVLLYFSFDWIIKIWIKEPLEFSSLLVVLMGLFILIRIYGDIYMTFLNGIGKIKLQMWLYVFGAVINIPLSIFFVKSLDLGSSGVILATSISLIGLAIIMPIQTKKILNE